MKRRITYMLVSLTLIMGIICPSVAEEAPGLSFDTVGSIVTVGRYEQDGDEENVSEESEWIVLDVQDGKSLLLSRYLLDAVPYHTKSKNMTWKDCSLRKWLNQEFLEAAFTEGEQEVSLVTEVDNSKKQGWKKWKKTKGGKNTKDRIFLLSFAEANQYLGVSREGSDNPLAWAEVTEYALRKGAYFVPLEGLSSLWNEGDPAYGCWWLRSPGYVQYDAADVNQKGTLIDNSVISEETCIRPAFWLDLNVVNWEMESV